MLTSNDLTCDLDILLPSHEDQDITSWMREMNLQRLLDCTVDIVFARRFAEQYIHWKCSARNSEAWRLVVEVRELCRLSEEAP